MEMSIEINFSGTHCTRSLIHLYNKINIYIWVDYMCVWRTKSYILQVKVAGGKIVEPEVKDFQNSPISAKVDH